MHGLRETGPHTLTPPDTAGPWAGPGRRSPRRLCKEVMRHEEVVGHLDAADVLTVAGAPVVEDRGHGVRMVRTDLDSLAVGISHHLIKEGEQYRFDVDSARAAGESALVIQAGQDFNAMTRDTASTTPPVSPNGEWTP